MDPSSRRTYYNKCHPLDTLDPGDDRYVNIDEIDPEHPVRGEDWVARLAARIQLSDRPVYELFTGLPGSGKSTELRRLVQRLQANHGLLPVLIDGEDAIDLSNPIDVPDIYVAIVYYTDAKVLELEGKSAAGAMHEGYLVRFWNWITTTDINFKQAEFAITDKAKLVVELKDRPSLRAQVRRAVAAHLPRFLDEAHEELRQLEQRAIKLGFGGLAVIFDSLEKLRGTSTNWNEVMESAERIFGSGASYLRLPVHVLYTIPAALTVRLRLDAVHFLPMIKLQHRSGDRFGPGVDAAYMIATKRVPMNALREIFGEESEARLERLVAWSGGYPREIADRLLQNNAVLRYLNDRDWFDIHPAVRRIPGVSEEIARQQDKPPLVQ